ncbi:hypothetical protein [Nocardia abscessus]|uniref:hypothetical protein n=1 Tax=Nocardia abscessus TaxID=120957 RepID=UPI0024586CE0|nr:hypothetical protein [Nocardia abscessus]
MSDGYSRDRDDFEQNERGRIFENGADKFFRDRENGYTRGSRKYEFRDQNGRIERIKFDKIKNEHDRSRASSIEEKSGRIEGRKDEKQLRGIRELLDNREINHHTLRSVEGEFISKNAQELIRGLIQDFGDRFTHQIISRADAREIWARGLQLEQGKQLELPGVGEKARQQKAQQREQRGKAAELVKKARERADKFRKMLRFREAATRGRADAPQKIERDRQAREEAERARQARGTDERARVERVAAERVAQEFPVPNQFQEREPADTGEHAARDAADAASLERAAADARTAEEKAREAREAADKERAEELARLQARGVPPKVVKILGLGQAEPPSAAVREPPGHAPGVVRGGTGQGQERNRGITRGR